MDICLRRAHSSKPAACTPLRCCGRPMGQTADMELGHWVTGSMGHLSRPVSPGHHFDPV